MINEKGVTWRCAAHQPRFTPFHLRFHPLLRRSFGLPLSSFFFASSYLYAILIPLLLLLLCCFFFLFSFLFAPLTPKPTDISILILAALSNFRRYSFQRYRALPRRCPSRTFPPTLISPWQTTPSNALSTKSSGHGLSVY